MKCFVVDTSKSPYAKLKPVPINSVKLLDKFWAPRLEKLRKVTLPSQYEILEKTGRIENFRVAARKQGKISAFWLELEDSSTYLIQAITVVGDALAQIPVEQRRVKENGKFYN